MAWIGKSQGTFKLHDSDSYCGSFMSIEDAAEILSVEPKDLRSLQIQRSDGSILVSELDIHRAWGTGKINSPQPHKVGNAQRSFDELIVMKLLDITLPGCKIEYQVPFGRKYVDIRATYSGKTVLIEFVGPSHFIPQYQRDLISPIERKKQVEDYFQAECVIWPFWIQRCASNIKAIFDSSTMGMASVWSTKAFFGDFVYPNSAQIILEVSNRYRAIRESGIGYMYGNSHTNKPVHPIVQKIIESQEKINRLIPRGNDGPLEFWLPEVLREGIYKP